MYMLRHFQNQIIKRNKQLLNVLSVVRKVITLVIAQLSKALSGNNKKDQLLWEEWTWIETQLSDKNVQMGVSTIFLVRRTTLVRLLSE